MICMTSTGRLLATLLAGITVVSGLRSAHASDHLDTPTVAMNPRADIGDLYAWTSADGKQLNLVMTIVGHSFSDVVEYAFHVDSGKALGVTTDTTTISCQFSAISEPPVAWTVRNVQCAYSLVNATIRSSTT